MEVGYSSCYNSSGELTCLVQQTICVYKWTIISAKYFIQIHYDVSAVTLVIIKKPGCWFVSAACIWNVCYDGSEGTLLPITLKLAYPEVASSLQLNTKWRNFIIFCHWLLNPRRVIVFLSLATEPSESELRKEVKSGNSETVSIWHHHESVSLW